MLVVPVQDDAHHPVNKSIIKLYYLNKCILFHEKLQNVYLYILAFFIQAFPFLN